MEFNETQIIEDIRSLTYDQLTELNQFIHYLKFKSKIEFVKRKEKNLKELYKEFESEDKILAEEGIGDYLKNIKREDDGL
jgi:hypothetical protein